MAGEATARSPWVTGLWITTLLAGVAFSQERLPTHEELLELRRLEISVKRTGLERRRLMKLAQAPATQDDFDATYYQLNLNIYPADSSISGCVELRALATVDSLETVVLDLYTNMIVDSVGGDADTLFRVDDLLLIQLSRPRQTGESFIIQVAYHGQPVRYGLGGPFAFDYHGDNPIIWSLSEPYFARA